MMARIARSIAIAIAAAAVVDPALTIERNSKPIVAVIAADAADSALVQRVAHELDGAFTPITAAFPAASATVIVGDEVPPFPSDATAPVFAVVPAAAGRGVRIAAVNAPVRAPFDARVPVEAVVDVARASGRTLTVTLLSGDLVVDRMTRDVDSAPARIVASLAFAPTAPGLAPLRVIAQLGDAAAAADLAVEVTESRWSVLFYDARPSWMSTFVRRALERDARFVVTGRTMTSRNISTAVGPAPAALGDARSLEGFDAIVVGAPESLSTGEAAGLDDYLRQRGGGVLLLFDREPGGPIDGIVRAGAWSTEESAATVDITASANDSSGLRAASLAWPVRLPAGARTFALAGARPVVWSTAAGAGRLVVSGALDAWRFRAAEGSAFDVFWQTRIADLAASSPRPIDLRAEPVVAVPGQRVRLVATLRSAALGDATEGGTASAVLSANLSGAGTNRPVRFWPDGPPGRLRAELRAPNDPGRYRVVLESGAERGTADIHVARDARSAAPRADDALAAWAHSTGGAALSLDAIRALNGPLRDATRPAPRRVPWHPMRSPWWIVPFVLALGFEWWSRRRRGLA